MSAPSKRWALTAFLAVLPITAILHHRVFFPPTCILQPLEVSDYSLQTLNRWLRSDPAPTMAAVIAAIVYVLGCFYEKVKEPTLAFVIAFMPLALWIWDIPFSTRLICRSFHDGRVGLHTRHFFAVGAVGWLIMMFGFRRPTLGAVMPRTRLAELQD